MRVSQAETDRLVALSLYVRVELVKQVREGLDPVEALMRASSRMEAELAHLEVKDAARDGKIKELQSQLAEANDMVETWKSEANAVRREKGGK